ncbi:hypothetical protein F2Q70_00036163 [Brassica cretica]|uniref:Uncharacterized protein n=1 Tax=Brassica cretica TaxID=69181 RepID=A0A8S9JXE3_BRACR|nr:hypothetical protein F2Q70_00036163 [Brassica cretica]
MSGPIQKSSVDVGVAPDLDIMQGPEGCPGPGDYARTRGLPRNLEVTTRTGEMGSEPGDPEVIGEPGGRPIDPEIASGTRRSLGNPKEPGGSSLDPEIFDWIPEAIFGTRRFFLIFYTLDPKSYGEVWVSSLDQGLAYGKSLTCLEGAGVGVMTQVPGFAAFHVWRSRVLIAPCFQVVLTAYSGLRIPIPALCLIPIAFFCVGVPLWTCHCGRATLDVPLFDEGWPGSGDLIQLDLCEYHLTMEGWDSYRFARGRGRSQGLYPEYFVAGNRGAS